jgi:hypothetical protein
MAAHQLSEGFVITSLAHRDELIVRLVDVAYILHREVSFRIHWREPFYDQLYQWPSDSAR